MHSKKWLTLALMATTLSACSDKAEENTTQLACNDPAVIQNVRNNIQDTIKQDARAFAQNDTRQFVDADKVIAAASELLINLENAKQENRNGTQVCTANLDIRIPAGNLTATQTNSPLLYPDQTIPQIIQQRTTGTTLQYDGSGRFTQNISYTPVTDNGLKAVNYTDNNLTSTAQLLSAVLMPYGIKDILVINGQPVNRADALNYLKQPPVELPPSLDPQDILDNNAASTVMSGTENTQPAEVLTPAITNNEEILFSANELEQARTNNRNADNEINALWNRIDPTVQQSLLSEQRSWIQSKNNSCRQAAATANTTLQAEYMQLQCDTRMTRERSQYLRGYTIN
ncbi:hypothetical protein PL75_05200 [Neisseria arctica]|uniref:Lysozyme inhibitor LprI-like N-terminal domain-containing protein n=1 Tax=Neisseria arctica TaxID=1470200 RepID=A0A0J1C471_9NEIS|nr:lysozyme inhibitor LprI family protein [Neisseria arctica]KLT73093.1 hypothetical protein PL75_05200 [Neisseria arctica]UOO86789.1 DUF1311 domain-containing protein [Neisseria arctica]